MANIGDTIKYQTILGKVRTVRIEEIFTEDGQERFSGEWLDMPEDEARLGSTVWGYTSEIIETETSAPQVASDEAALVTLEVGDIVRLKTTRQETSVTRVNTINSQQSRYMVFMQWRNRDELDFISRPAPFVPDAPVEAESKPRETITVQQYFQQMAVERLELIAQQQATITEQAARIAALEARNNKLTEEWKSMVVIAKAAQFLVDHHMPVGNGFSRTATRNISKIDIALQEWHTTIKRLATSK